MDSGLEVARPPSAYGQRFTRAKDLPACDVLEHLAQRYYSV
jgi:hypothetical protein